MASAANAQAQARRSARNQLGGKDDRRIHASNQIDHSAVPRARPPPTAQPAITTQSDERTLRRLCDNNAASPAARPRAAARVQGSGGMRRKRPCANIYDVRASRFCPSSAL